MLYLSVLIYVAALYIRPAEMVPALAGVPVVEALSIGVAVIVAGALLFRPRRLFNTPIDLYFLLFWTAIVASNLVWGWFGGAYQGFKDFEPVVFCYFLIRLGIDTPQRARGFVVMLIVLNLFLAVNGIVQYHTGIGLGDVTTVGYENRIRGTGIFHDPNDLGMTLAMTVPFLLAFVLGSEEKVWRRAAAGLILLPLLVAIVYTNSRGTVLGLGGALLLFGIRRFKPVPGLAFAAIALLGLLFLGPSRAQAMDSQESSAQSRIEAWGDGLMMLKSKPVLGVGYGRFTEFHRQVAHNSFVHSAAELGLAGAFLLVAMFDGMFKSLRQARRGALDGTGLDVRSIDALQASGVAMIICAFFLSRQYVAVPYVMLALSASVGAFARSREPRSFGMLGDFTRIALLTASMVAAIYLSVRTMGAW